MSVGSAPSGRRTLKLPSVALSFATSSAPSVVVALRRREVDVQVGPVADAEVVEPDRPLAGRRLDQRRRAAAEVEVVRARERRRSAARRRPMAWASARAPGSARQLRTAQRTPPATAVGSRRRGRRARLGGGDRRLDELGPDPDRRQEVPRDGREDDDRRDCRDAAGQRVAPRDRRPVAAAREEEHADDRRGAERHREVAVVVEEARAGRRRDHRGSTCAGIVADRGDGSDDAVRRQAPAGSVSQNVVQPASDVAPTRPPASSTSWRTIASPIPAPPRARSRDFSTR